MAEETTQEQQQTPQLDETRLAALIKEHSSTSVKEALAELRQQSQQEYQQQQAQAQQQETQPSFWDEQINPRLAPVQQEVRGARLRAEAAEDKADFYQSDFWTEEISEWLPGDTDAELKTERGTLRKKIEDTFSKMMKEGRPLPRADIAKHALAEYLTENKVKVQEKTKKRAKAQVDQELEHAKRAVDMSAGNIVNFEPEAVHSMSSEDIHEKYGQMVF